MAESKIFYDPVKPKESHLNKTYQAEGRVSTLNDVEENLLESVILTSEPTDSIVKCASRLAKKSLTVNIKNSNFRLAENA